MSATNTSRGERPDSGFTLIELLVVVVIFSLLAFFVSGNVLSSFESARSASNTQIPIPEEITLVALMLEFASLAVLLFGAGFWYLVELHEVGRLDRCRQRIAWAAANATPAE